MHPLPVVVTLTLDPARVNRYDVREVTRHLNHWLDNQVRRKGLAYVLVPERHKDGAIHFHGFFNDALEARDSGTVSLPGQKAPRRPRSARQRAKWLEDGGNPSTTFPAGSWGFTTAIELYGEYDRAVSYVCKYIGKELAPSPNGDGPGAPEDWGPLVLLRRGPGAAPGHLRRAGLPPGRAGTGGLPLRSAPGGYQLRPVPIPGERG